MSILFRTDASPSIGSGHLTRCKALAKSLKKNNFNIYMLGPSKSYIEKSDQNVFISWEEKIFQNEIEDFDYLFDFAKRKGIKIIILDDYRIKNIYQKRLSKSNFKVVQFESRYQFNIYADLIINSTLGAKINKYKNLINKKSRLLMGPKYSSLREEFLFLDKVDRANKFILKKRIYVNFGGGDDKGAIQKILSFLTDTIYLEIIVVSSKENPRNKDNLKVVNNLLHKLNIKYLISPDYISKIINSCDIAIIAGGTSTFEVSFCGLPMIIITIANNQVLHADDWVSRGAAFHLSSFDNLKKKNLIQTLLQIFQKNIYTKMSKACYEIVDGLGTERINKCITELNLMDK